MPLNQAIKEKLLLLKKKQEENRRICGNCYNHEFDGYVFVDPMGELYRPDYVYNAFKRVLKQYGFKNIRLHDLRHSCASLMVTKGDGINNVQKWLGHSDIGTTANIYAHLDFQSKFFEPWRIVIVFSISSSTGKRFRNTGSKSRVSGVSTF